MREFPLFFLINVRKTYLGGDAFTIKTIEKEHLFLHSSKNLVILTQEGVSCGSQRITLKRNPVRKQLIQRNCSARCQLRMNNGS